MSAGTAYAKRYGGGFLDLPTKTTPVDQQFLNAVEAALLQLIGSAPTADGQVAQWDNANTRFGPALILNKNIDPAAAIAKSKLDFTGANGIVNADVAGAAAIARSKLNFGSGLVDADIAAAAAIANSKLAIPLITTSTFAGGPPGIPADKDIWIATAVDANGTRWAFQYNAGSASTYKWEFIGGSPVHITDSSGQTYGLSAWAETGPAAVRYTIVRGGDYGAVGVLTGAGSAGGAGTQIFGYGTVAGGSPAAADQFSNVTAASAAYTVPIEARLNALAVAAVLTSWGFSNVANATTLKTHTSILPYRII